MAADATLVNAAFREAQTGAMADVPSMAPMFESQKRVQKTYMDTITNVMNVVQKKKDASELAKTTQLKPIKEDMLKLMDKVDSLEQMIHNLNAKTKDQYKLINDRISEAFDIIKILEKEK